MARSSRSWRMQTLPLHLETLETRTLLTLLGNPLFPADNPWNQRIDGAPVANNSATLVASIGLSAGLHPDFGATLWEGAAIGIPFNVVTSAQPKVPIIVDAYPDESDLVAVPIPPQAVIEGDPLPGNQNTGDRHLLVYDRESNILYEGFNVHRPSETPDGQWHADALAYWDLNTNHFRPPGWTSADAAGLPILPGLIRPEEVLETGYIDHAIRMTVPRSRNQYVFPASHQAGSNNAALPRMGERLRLRQDFDISGFSPANQIILQAMKEYGLIVADNGSPWFISGIPSNLWNDDELHELGQVRGSSFEVVDLMPRLSALDRVTGPTTGAFQVTIDGLNFGGAAGQMQVYFGAAAATDVVVKSDTQVVVTAPAHPAESVQVSVRSPYGNSAPAAAGLFTYGDTGPQPGRIQFAARNFRASEADPDALITVLRTDGTDGTVTVHYATGSGTATSGTDYLPASGSLTFAAGETSKTVRIALREDTAVEGRETVRLSLTAPTGGAVLGTPRTATLLIQDNDGSASGRFIAQVYQDVLSRPVDEGGLRSWTAHLGEGSNPAEVVQAIAGSPEARARQVSDAYRQWLGRDPDPAGLAAWVQTLNQDRGEEQLQIGLLGSAEFFGRSGGTQRKFLESLYVTVLGRELDATGAQGWEQALRQGSSRASVARAVLGSEERLQQEAEGLYDRYLDRPADVGGLEALVAVLREQTRREEVLARMMGSAEYVSGCG